MQLCSPCFSYSNICNQNSAARQFRLSHVLKMCYHGTEQICAKVEDRDWNLTFSRISFLNLLHGRVWELTYFLNLQNLHWLEWKHQVSFNCRICVCIGINGGDGGAGVVNEGMPQCCQRERERGPLKKKKKKEGGGGCTRQLLCPRALPRNVSQHRDQLLGLDRPKGQSWHRRLHIMYTLVGTPTSLHKHVYAL